MQLDLELRALGERLAQESLELGPDHVRVLPRRETNRDVRTRLHGENRLHEIRRPAGEPVHVQRRARERAHVELVGGAGRDRDGAVLGELLAARRKLRPGFALLGGRRSTARPQRLGKQPVRAGLDGAQRGHQRMRRIQCCRSEHPGVHVRRPRPHTEMEIQHPANGDRERRQPSPNHRAVEDESRIRRAVVLLDPLHDRVAADLLLAVERETHVHRELAGCGELRGRLDEDQQVDLVVGDAARVKTSVARSELEGRRLPELERVGRLYVEVRVAEDRGRLVGPVGRAHLADHERTAHSPRDDLGRAATVTDPGGNPRRGRLHVRRMRRVGAH